MRIYAATKNAGKLRELRALFLPLGIEMCAYGGYADPAEGESSYASNAALKARALAAQLRAAGVRGAALGDDSGLEVAALDGRPGVLSARYGGAATSWPERRAMLCAEVAASGRSEREARFVCALHLIDAEGGEYSVFEVLDGEIVFSDRGDAGFSYDPIFLYPPAGKTFGELSEEEKNAISHRARAVRALQAAMGKASPSRGSEARKANA
jgi:XTP/dITP diphosphohydrolase